MANHYHADAFVVEQSVRVEVFLVTAQHYSGPTTADPLSCMGNLVAINSTKASAPPQHGHKCEKCGDVLWLKHRYPYKTYKTAPAWPGFKVDS